MTEYVIKKGGFYVSKHGFPCSYTAYLANARVYPSKEAAEADMCPENEVAVPRSGEMRI